MSTAQINILNLVLLGLASGMLLYLLYRRSRQAPVVFSWSCGLLYGLPFFSSSLVVFAFMFIGVSVFIPESAYLIPALFFGLNALLFFVAGWFGVQLSVTHTHIVTHPWFPTRDIPIRAIRDYYFHTHGFLTRVTLLVQRQDGLKKISFTMPARYMKLFDQVIEQRSLRSQSARQPEPVRQK
ncbi:MAG: hypothetical protein HUU10_06950 [Bacteroidetes bacterium]|nr:hypothetical protein [Bacteroidota bacterium]